jgi:hypothetical protein
LEIREWGKRMNFNMEDIVFVPTVCEKCGVEGTAPTFKQILEKKESILAQMLEKDGHAKILCKTCAEVAVDAYKEKEEKK